MFKLFGRSSKKSAALPTDRDIEDEGFVLIGETRSERVAKSNSNRDAPPSYHSQIRRMGANQSSSQDAEDTRVGNTQSAGTASADYMTLTQDYFSNPGANVQQTPGPGPLPYEMPKKTTEAVQQSAPSQIQEIVSPKTVYEDIPFKLSPALELTMRNGGGIHAATIPIQKPNLGAYYYDFSLERSTLKDTR